MNNNVIRASLDELSYAFVNIGGSNLQECSNDERKISTLADASSHFAHVGVSFFATATVAHDQYGLSNVRHDVASR
jgi:hypothetical protein